MTELKVHQCLISYGNLAMLLVLKELEENEEYEKCAIIKNGIDSWNKKHFSYLVLDTRYSTEVEKDYYKQFRKITNSEGNIAKENMQYYIREVKQKLEI